MNSHTKTTLLSRSLGACAALLLLTVPAAPRAVQHVGLVLDVRGEWVLYEGGKVVGRVEPGQGVPAGGTVRPTPPGTGWVVILLPNDRVIKCEAGNMGDCRRPFGPGRKPSGFGRFYAAVINLFSGKGLEYESAAPRTPHSTRLREAVLGLDADQVDLAPVFEQAGEGRYHLLFTAAGRDAHGEPFPTVALNWKRGGAAKVAVRGLKPGLYRLLLLDETMRDEPSGPEAWVLVTDAARFAAASAAFGEARAWSERWRARGSGDAERIFLRAYLDSLRRTSIE